jgi:hypothetical protein
MLSTLFNGVDVTSPESAQAPAIGRPLLTQRTQQVEGCTQPLCVTFRHPPPNSVPAAALAFVGARAAKIFSPAH